MSEYQREYDHFFKIVIVGDSGVGKSCLLIRFADSMFTNNYIATIGVDFRFRTMEVDHETIKFQIWDTAGHERFRSINSSYFRSCDGAILCYDVCRKMTFSQVSNHLEQVQEKGEKHSAKILVGTKSDMEELREVPYEFGQDLADQLNIPFLEVSAKSNQNVDATFEELGRRCIYNKHKEDRQQHKQQHELRRLSKERVSLRIGWKDIKESVRQNDGCC